MRNQIDSTVPLTVTGSVSQLSEDGGGKSTLGFSTTGVFSLGVARAAIIFALSIALADGPAEVFDAGARRAPSLSCRPPFVACFID